MPIPVINMVNTNPVPLVGTGLRALSPVDAAAGVRAVGDGSAQAGGDDNPSSRRSGPDRAEVEAAAQALEEHFQLRRAALRFSVDESTDRIVVQVLDAHDGSLIRQIPSIEALRLAHALQSETPPLIEEVA